MILMGVNFTGVLVAALAAWLAGAVWYAVLGSARTRALGKTAAELMPGGRPPLAALALCFFAEVVMAWILAGLLAQIGDESLPAGLVLGLFLGFGFAFLAVAVNASFSRQPASLVAIDGGHWLLVLALEGAVVGWFGPR